MLNDLTFQIRLHRILRRKRRVERIYAKDWKKAREEEWSHDQRAILHAQESSETDPLEDERLDLLNFHLMTRADLYSVSVPSFSGDADGHWERSEFTGKWRLTKRELETLRQRVRAERRERWEYWHPLTFVLAAIGTITGVLALFLS